MSEYRIGWQKILSQGIHTFVITLGNECKHLTSFILAAIVTGYLHQAFHEVACEHVDEQVRVAQNCTLIHHVSDMPLDALYEIVLRMLVGGTLALVN
ncbi:MAG: hypothetical protein HXM66_07375 [Mogibacterium diversum]|nr:hypothetical protein [Mogibacterium diversum]